jgi:hypothetical protein
MTRVPNVKQKTDADRRQDAAREQMRRDTEEKSWLFDFVFATQQRALIFFWVFVALIVLVLAVRLNLMMTFAGMMQ